MKIRGKLTKAMLTGGVALGALQAGAATAADAPAAAAVQAASAEAAAVDNNDIIVTANKREERLLDVGGSLSAVSGAELSYRNLVKIEDFAAQVPGFNIQPLGPRAIRLILRGLNSGGSSATSGVIVDETPFSYQSGLANGAIDTANLDTFDMARIEVLKGPQGTLYGATAEGGLLKYVTNAPNTTKVEAAVELGSEIVDQGQVGFTTKGMINVPFWDGKAAIRASGFYVDVPGFVDDPLIGKNNVNDGKRYGGRISLLLKPTDALSIRLTAARQDQKFGDNSAVQVVGSNASPFTPPANQYDIINGGRLVQNSYYNNPSRNFYEYANALIGYDFGFADFLSSTSYGKLSSKFNQDITFSNAAPGFTYSQAFSPIYGETIAVVQNQTNAIKRVNQEFRLSSKPDSQLFGMGFDWQVGAFYAHEDVVFNQFFDIVSIKVPGKVITSPLVPGGAILPGKYKEYSGFANATLHITETFDISAGGRYTDNRQRSQVFDFAGLLYGPADLVLPVIKTHETKGTYQASARWHFNPDSLLYARIATGYRPGGPNLLIPGAPADYPASYDADTTTNYEVGIRSSLFDRMVTIDVAAFYIDWKDIQILSQIQSSTTGQVFNVTGNAGKASSKGIEWNLSVKPLKGLEISTVGAYTDAHLTRDALLLGAKSGDNLPYVPKWSNTLNVDYDTTLWGETTGFIGASWSYVGQRRTDFGGGGVFAGHIPIPSYNQVNAQAGVNFGRYSLSAYVRNIGNERGLTVYGRGNGGGGVSGLSGTAQIITPRTVGVKFTATY